MDPLSSMPGKRILTLAAVGVLALSGTGYALYRDQQAERRPLPAPLSLPSASSPASEASSIPPQVLGETASQETEAPSETALTSLPSTENPLLRLRWQENARQQLANGDFIIKPDGVLALARRAVTAGILGWHVIEAADIDSNSVTSRTIRDKTVTGDDLADDLSLGTVTVRKGLTVEGDATLAGNLDVDGMISGSFAGAFAPSGDVDMATHILTNIGDNGTDFTTTGGLTLADTLTVSSGGASVTGTLTLPSLTQGSIPFIGAGGALSEDATNLYWDGTNHRLGIGTENPSSILEVYQNSLTNYNSPMLTIKGGSSKQYNRATIRLEQEQAADNAHIFHIELEKDGPGTTGGTYINFRRFSDDSASILDPLSIDSNSNVRINRFKMGSAFTYGNFLVDNGNVGIGDSTPASLLTVGNGDLFQVNSSGAFSNTVATGNAGTITNTGTGNSFVVNDQAGDTTPFVIDASGNVGIGTGSPPQPLYAISSTLRTAWFSNSNPSSGIALVLENTVSAVNQQITLDFAGINSAGGSNSFGRISTLITDNTSGSVAGDLQMLTRSAATGLSEKLRITGTGNVGIGTSTPGTKLAVAGLTGTSSYNLVRVDTATGNFYYDSSSARYKDDIHPFEEDFSKILDLTVKEYTDKASKQSEIGLIAEELDAAGLSHLVIYKDGVPDAIKYDRIPMYLLGVLQNQEKRISDLEADGSGTHTSPDTLDTLAARVDTLETMNTSLITFYKSLSLDTLLMKDVDGNLDLGDGTLLAKKVKAETVDTKDIATDSLTVRDNEDSPTLGTATIKAGETEVTVETGAVTEKSRIFVTPEVALGEAPAVTDRKDGKSFMVEVLNAPEKDLPFSWWIVESGTEAVPAPVTP